eukprot:Polyplicarium_translucidae@DN2363_c0_g1_i1.p5
MSKWGIFRGLRSSEDEESVGRQREQPRGAASDLESSRSRLNAIFRRRRVKPVDAPAPRAEEECRPEPPRRFPNGFSSLMQALAEEEAPPGPVALRRPDIVTTPPRADAAATPPVESPARSTGEGPAQEDVEATSDDVWQKNRAVARQRQIAVGKATLEYRAYIRRVPRQDRGDDDPKTPNACPSTSWKCWQEELMAWRLQLHSARRREREGDGRPQWRRRASEAAA